MGGSTLIDTATDNVKALLDQLNKLKERKNETFESFMNSWLKETLGIEDENSFEALQMKIGITIPLIFIVHGFHTGKMSVLDKTISVDIEAFAFNGETYAKQILEKVAHNTRTATKVLNGLDTYWKYIIPISPYCTKVQKEGMLLENSIFDIVKNNSKTDIATLIQMVSSKIKDIMVEQAQKSNVYVNITINPLVCLIQAMQQYCTYTIEKSHKKESDRKRKENKKEAAKSKKLNGEFKKKLMQLGDEMPLNFYIKNSLVYVDYLNNEDESKKKKAKKGDPSITPMLSTTQAKDLYLSEPFMYMLYYGNNAADDKMKSSLEKFVKDIQDVQTAALSTYAKGGNLSKEEEITKNILDEVDAQRLIFFDCTQTNEFKEKQEMFLKTATLSEWARLYNSRDEKAADIQNNIHEVVARFKALPEVRNFIDILSSLAPFSKYDKIIDAIYTNNMSMMAGGSFMSKLKSLGQKVVNKVKDIKANLKSINSLTEEEYIIFNDNLRLKDDITAIIEYKNTGPKDFKLSLDNKLHIEEDTFNVLFEKLLWKYPKFHQLYGDDIRTLMRLMGTEKNFRTTENLFGGFVKTASEHKPPTPTNPSLKPVEQAEKEQSDPDPSAPKRQSLPEPRGRSPSPEPSQEDIEKSRIRDRGNSPAEQDYVPSSKTIAYASKAAYPSYTETAQMMVAAPVTPTYAVHATMGTPVYTPAGYPMGSNTRGFMGQFAASTDKIRVAIEKNCNESLKNLERFIEYMQKKSDRWMADMDAVVKRDFDGADGISGKISRARTATGGELKSIKSDVKRFFHKFVRLAEKNASVYFNFIRNYYIKESRNEIKDVLKYIELYAPQAAGGLLTGGGPQEYQQISSKFAALCDIFDKNNIAYYDKLQKFIDSYCTGGNLMVLDDDVSLSLKTSVESLQSNIIDYGKKLKSYYRLNYSMSDVLFDSQFIILYIIKLIRIGFTYLALFLTTRVFTPIYEEVVFDQKLNPPSMNKFILIFLAFDISFNVFIFVVLFLLKFLFKSEDNSFPIDKYLFQKYLIDYGMSLALLVLLGMVIAYMFTNKKYFHYKYEGMRAIRAYQEGMFLISCIINVFPYFWIV